MTTTLDIEQRPVGERIAWARRHAGLSQEGLADLVGTSRRHVIRWERGHHRPGPGYAAKLAEATGQPAQLFADEDGEETGR